MQYAILILVAFIAAIISGSAGFGGALLILPLLVAVVGPQEAVPLLTVAQMIGNLSRAGFGFRQIDWKSVGAFLIGAIPCCVIGAISFLKVPGGIITRVIGVAVLVFAVLKFFKILKLKPSNRLLFTGGAITGFISGLVGSAGTLGAAVFLSLGLPPVAYIASEATTAVAMHATKTIIYGNSLTLDNQFWTLGLILGLAMIAGSWLANRLIRRLSQINFDRYVLVLLILLSIYLIVRG